MKGLVETFQEISTNVIILSREGHTLCALLSGQFSIPEAASQKIMEVMRKWKEDETGRVPPFQGTKRKRSYDDRNYVSRLRLVVFKSV
jgi:hypothetical protein